MLVTFEAISFDLFNTLVGIKPTEKKVLIQILDDCLIDIGLEKDNINIRRLYISRLEEQFKIRQDTHHEFNNAVLLQEVIKSITNQILPLKMCELIIDRYFDFVPTFIFKDVPEVLEQLAEHFQLYVISNHSWPKAAFRAINPIKDYFQEIIISGVVGWRKPSKLIFNPIFRKHGKKVLHCGDHGQEDIDAVYPLGWKAIWIKRSNNCRPPRIRNHLIGIIHDLREILKIIT